MAETNVAESVLTTQAITTQETAPVVNQEAAPDVDILTRVSQFKSPSQEKIENAPEQPEFATITDPVAKKAAMEAVERMRRGIQSSADKKIQEAQQLVNQSKSWTPQRIQQDLLTNPEFLQAAQMIQGVKSPSSPAEENAYSVLSDEEKAKVNLVPGLQAELQQMKNQSAQQALLNSISQKDAILKAKFSNYDPQAINAAAQRFGSLTPADAREYIYKADKYEESVKNAYEMGKLEGQGKLNGKLNIITPQGTTVVNNEGVPSKAAGESDKAFFVRLGQFRLAQFKTQK
jgi:hypothetical protein